VILEYSPESFTGTELDFAVEICDAVMREWGASPAAPVILNLPATVEMATPNVYADQIEWFARHVADRASAVLSIHPHNDRGTAVAAAELALMAGAERVEGTLFGNGERSGNVDLVTLALNLYTQGVAPGLDVSDLNEILAVAEHCTGLAVHPRHPYAGELVFTAFSGTHQDAIKKGVAARAAGGGGLWEVPYLPIDPADVGRAYEPVVRINSQSGKGGVAFVLEHDFGFVLPKRLQVEFAPRVQEIAERTGAEVSAKRVWDAFEAEYLAQAGPLWIREETLVEEPGGAAWTLSALLDEGRGERRIQGRGNGPIDALVDALRRGAGLDLRVVDYREHALGEGADAAAVAYVEVRFADGATRFGVGVHRSIVSASLAAVVSAVNRARPREEPGAA
jgi:2-isopropylmalate synthase